MPHEDPTGCFVVSAAGVFIEAVSLLCANEGLGLDTELYKINLDQPMIPVARLKLVETPCVVGDASLTDHLGTRRTSRLSHTGKVIAAESADQLTALAQQHGQSFEFTTDPDQIAQMMARNNQAIIDDMNNKAYQAEFVGWLRRKRAAAETRDGLATENMRFSLIDEFMLRRMPWLLRLPLIGTLIARHYDRLLGQTDHIGWFTGPFWEYDQAVTAGRFLLRFWLMLDRAGMSMHPLGNLATNPDKNYVKPYTLESRCYGGLIPDTGVIIDESSGSSGQPSNWVRGREEQRSVSKLLQNAYRQEYAGDKQLIVLNCFSLGVWATGMNVTMSLADIAIIKSIGPDKQRLESTLQAFGPNYRYLIAGYPPFLKSFADTATVNLNDYDAHLVVGGEGMSEGLRTHLLRHFTSVRSSYGASDLEINIGAETAFTIAIRRACSADAELCQTLFGKATPPMIFQYSPGDYYIETNDDGELLFTIARNENIAPKIRYNLRDVGGVMSIKQLESELAKQGVDLASITPVQSHLPLLYVFGRSDLTLAFYGANIAAGDIETVLSRDPRWVEDYSSFRMCIEEEPHSSKQTLVVTLECSENYEPDRQDLAEMARSFLGELTAINPDIREAARLFEPYQVRIDVIEHGTGPFADQDVRLKHHYVYA
eukprot:g11999.t1